jgi:hypothetical protein
MSLMRREYPLLSQKLLLRLQQVFHGGTLQVQPLHLCRG